MDPPLKLSHYSRSIQVLEHGIHVYHFCSCPILVSDQTVSAPRVLLPHSFRLQVSWPSRSSATLSENTTSPPLQTRTVIGYCDRLIVASRALRSRGIQGERQSSGGMDKNPVEILITSSPSDLVVAGQAAHWFNFSNSDPSLRRKRPTARRGASWTKSSIPLP